MREFIELTAELDAETVEQGWRTLWAKQAEAEKNEGLLVKRSVLNLIAVVADTKGAEAVSAIIPVLARQHPGRFIILILNPEKEMLTRQVNEQVQCQLIVDCSVQTCYEILIMPNVPGRAPDLPKFVQGLLHHEFPVVLWWRYIFSPNENLFNEFSRFASRVIIDSVSLKSPAKGFAKIIELNNRVKTNNVVRDINWARLTPWRFALAGFYDIPVYQPFLSGIDQVEIEYTHQLSRHNFINNSQVLFMFGWLASRLGWRPLSGIIQEQPEILHRIEMACGGGRITCYFRIYPAASHREAGLRRIILKSERASPGWFAVALCEDGCHMQTQISLPGKKTVEKISCLEVGSEVDIVGKEMNVGAQDDVYEQTLAYLERTEILWKPEMGETRQ